MSLNTRLKYGTRELNVLYILFNPLIEGCYITPSVTDLNLERKAQSESVKINIQPFCAGHVTKRKICGTIGKY